VFKIVIQFGSILAVMWLYRDKIWSVALGLGGDPEARRFAVMVFAAFLPSAVMGALFADAVTGVLYETPAVYATAFVVGGVIMLAVERARPQPSVLAADRTPLSRAVAIGVCQTAALIPGVSRSGATIVGGLLAGLDRAAAAEFSFFLAIPTMAGAFVFEMWSARDLLGVERLTEITVGFVAAFVAALLVVRPFLRFVSRAGFAPFAWYRIVAGLGLFAAMAAGWQ
jgi:undecaprenyl-diphosphatase